jgi:single-strand DNA-binding protein
MNKNRLFFLIDHNFASLISIIGQHVNIILTLTFKFKNMNAMKNKVQLIGYVGQDPEVKNLDGGKKLANITIATNDYYINDKGEKVEQTEWHRLTAWGKVAEIIEKYVTKGKEVAVEGKLTHRSYEDKEGNKRYITEVVINDLLLLGK